MYKTTLLVVNVIFERHGRIIIKESCKSFDLQDSLAERGGFEPPIRFWRIHAFQAYTLRVYLLVCQRVAIDRLLICTLFARFSVSTPCISICCYLQPHHGS